MFEGDITKSQFREITTKLKEIIDVNEDSIIIFTTKTEELIKRQVIGIEKSKLDQIL